MTTPLTRKAILDTLAAWLAEQPWGAPPGICFLTQDGETAILRPPLPLDGDFWRQFGAPSQGLAGFVRALRDDADASPFPPGTYGLCFFSETRRVPGEQPRNPVARVLAPRTVRHLTATDNTGDIYDVWQARGDSPRRRVMSESDGWSGIGGTVPAALRQFAVAFLDAPSDLETP